MTIWALSDPHLALSVPEKTMEDFGPAWHHYTQKIQVHWENCVQTDDLVLLAGDISWAMHIKDALIDLEWIHALPGEKLILRGNHDYWWSSSTKMRQLLPPSMHFLQNSVFLWEDIAIGGSRLWDTSEYSFQDFVEYRENPKSVVKTPGELLQEKEDGERIFVRELERLRLSLSLLPKEAKYKIAMTHYPPIGADLAPSRASTILEEFGIDLCVFGHLHNLRKNSLPFGTARGVKYLLTSCDYLDFTPLKVFPF